MICAAGVPVHAVRTIRKCLIDAATTVNVPVDGVLVTPEPTATVTVALPLFTRYQSHEKLLLPEAPTNGKRAHSNVAVGVVKVAAPALAFIITLDICPGVNVAVTVDALPLLAGIVP